MGKMSFPYKYILIFLREKYFQIETSSVLMRHNGELVRCLKFIRILSSYAIKPYFRQEDFDIECKVKFFTYA